MTRVCVDLELLDELIAEMAVFGDRFGAVHDDVDSRMRRLRAGWDGIAAADQARAHEDWTAGAGEMHEALVGLRAIASIAQQNYASAVHAGLQLWAR